MHQTTQKCIVHYQIGTYSGEEVVYCDVNDDNDQIFSKCKKQLKQSGWTSLPMYHESYKIVSREDYFGN